jgi:hypothetical protein
MATYLKSEYDKKTGSIQQTRMQCEVLSECGSWLKIRITSHIVKGVPNCVLKVKRRNVIGYVSPNVNVDFKQYKD